MEFLRINKFKKSNLLSNFSYLLEFFSIILIEFLLSQLEDRDSDDEELDFLEGGEYLLFLLILF